VLRERVRFGTDTGAMSERQGRLLLRRQISQLPRWLAQVRYNGPPPTHLGKLTAKPRDFAANPALSDDGAKVVFEAYEQKLPRALKRGEISVLAASPRGGGSEHVSFKPGRRTPRSAYNATVSADGRRVAFESAEGNLNFAKRYGQIHVFVKDLTTGRTRKMPLPPARDGVSRSEYNPVISANGRRIAYQAQRGGGQSAVYVTDLRSGRATLASRATRSAAGANRGVYDPAISGDGTKIAFTTAASNLGAGDLRGHTQVFVRDLRARTTTLVSRASGARGAIADAYSADPAISADGRWVAFASAGRNLAGRVRGDGSRIYLRDLRTGRTRAVSGASEFALKPSISADGRVVAYTAMAGGHAQVLVRDLRRPGAPRVVSRASGVRGALGDGPSADAAISADGSHLAFTSAATNLSEGKADNRRGVFVRALRTDTTQLVSAPAPKAAAPAPLGSAPKSSGAQPPLDPQPRETATVAVHDNAFHRRGDRPTVKLRAGGVLTWRWAAQQSHQVTVRMGPQQIQTPPQAAGAYSARLKRRGTYQLVCAIHAPGMRMTVVVE
jgi:Tol biopolymer transport system component/plastocyanin